MPERGGTILLMVIRGIIRFLFHRNIMRKTSLLFHMGPWHPQECHLGCNAPAPFNRWMMSIFSDKVEDTIEVLMDDLVVVYDYFELCFNNFSEVLMRCEDCNLVLNWEKCHYTVK